MEQNFNIKNVSDDPVSPQAVCTVCHQPILPQYYFCPNCGIKINSAPLSTTTATQVWIYAFSIILPMLAFLFVTRWPGVKYFKSKDPKAKQIGQIAWTLLIISTIVTIWLVVVGTQNYIQATVNGINADMSSYGS
jgi:predicted nucleic acid-binding Zn ribbon protein